MKRKDHHLIQDVLDGHVTPEAFDAFQQRLRVEPGMLELYGTYSLLHHTLREEFEGGNAAGLRLLEAPRRSALVPTAIAAAAVLALLAVVMFTRPWQARGAQADVALVTFSVDAVWHIEGSSRSIGGATGVGGGSVLRLEYGRAGISLSPTVTALVEGPAELTLLSGDSVSMKSGKGYFTVSGSGGGLTLDTPRITASDFGAEFGIEVAASGDEEILVSAGEMRIVSKAGEGEAVLAAGEAAQIPSSGLIERFPGDDRRFAKTLGRFRSIVSSLGASQPAGDPVDVGIHTRFLRLPDSVTGSDGSVLLTTLNLVTPSEDAVAEGGSSFISLFSKGSEVLQLADAAEIPADRPVNAMGTVTLRYDQRTGDVSLHKGGLPLGDVICTGKIPPGSEFDEIRLGELAGSSLELTGLDIRVGGFE
jgi:hypothetical protein